MYVCMYICIYIAFHKAEHLTLFCFNCTCFSCDIDRFIRSGFIHSAHLILSKLFIIRGEIDLSVVRLQKSEDRRKYIASLCKYIANLCKYITNLCKYLAYWCKYIADLWKYIASWCKHIASWCKQPTCVKCNRNIECIRCLVCLTFVICHLKTNP